MQLRQFRQCGQSGLLLRRLAPPLLPGPAPFCYIQCQTSLADAPFLTCNASLAMPVRRSGQRLFALYK